MNTVWAVAVRTPMSRTRRARSANWADSSSGRPNSLTRVAPGAEKRSVIRVPMAALSAAASRSIRAIRLPMRRAGTTNTGSSTSARSVICQDRVSITASAGTRVTTLPTTVDRVLLKARWTPMTSLLRRETRAPVRVRVKNATGIRCTWSKTAVRRSRMRPSPSVADSRRPRMPSAASASAISAISRASRTTVLSSPPDTMVSTTRPARTGVATAGSAVAVPSRTKRVVRRRCGRANAPMRRSVTRAKGRRSSWAVMTLCNCVQAVVSMLMEGTV